MSAIQLQAVAKHYGDSRALDGITFDAPPGSFVVLLGPSGCGKTTTLRLIAGLDTPTSGTIAIGGRDVTQLPPAQRGIAMVFQSYALFPHLTVAENLEVGLAAAPRGTRVPDLVYELFPVLGEMRSRKGGVLSGGQQQQLAIGRALAARPRLLILDEPTEGVQPSIILQIEEALGRIRRELGMAILLVEQYLEFAWGFATSYFVMQKGRIVDRGRTADGDAQAVSRLLGV